MDTSGVPNTVPSGGNVLQWGRGWEAVDTRCGVAPHAPTRTLQWGRGWEAVDTVTWLDAYI